MTELFNYTGTRLATELKNQAGDTAGAQYTDAMILVWINNGIREIATNHPFIETHAQTNLLAGLNTYDIDKVMPNSRVQEFSMVTAAGRALRHFAFPEFKRLVEQGNRETAAGQPTSYTVFGGVLTLWPTPEETVARGLALYFHRMPEDLNSLDDKLTVPDRFYNSLKDYVLGEMQVLDANPEAAALSFQRHERSVQAQSVKHRDLPGDSYPQILPDPSDEMYE